MTETWTCVGLFGTCKYVTSTQMVFNKVGGLCKQDGNTLDSANGCSRKTCFQVIVQVLMSHFGRSWNRCGKLYPQPQVHFCPHLCTSCPPCSNRQSAMSVHKSTDKVEKCTRGCGMDISSLAFSPRPKTAQEIYKIYIRNWLIQGASPTFLHIVAHHLTTTQQAFY